MARGTSTSHEATASVAVRCVLTFSTAVWLEAKQGVLIEAPLQVADDKQYDWVARYESSIRVVPLGIGLVGTVGVLLNRFLSQVQS